MNDKLTDAVLKLIEQLQATAGEQLPLVLAEMLTYYTYEHWLVLIVAAVGCVSSLGGAALLLRDIKKQPYSSGDGREVGTVLLCGLAVMLLIVALYNVSMLVKLSIAPRLYLLDVIRGLL